MRFSLILAVLFAAGPFIGTAIAADPPTGPKADNPAYKHWSAFKVGTAVTIKTSIKDESGDNPTVVDATGAPGGPQHSLTHYKLLELTPEKAVVQAIHVDLEGENEVEQSPVKITYPAKISIRVHQTKDKTEDFKEGTEDVKVGVKTVKCQFAESTIKGGGEISVSKHWYSPEVPGGTVKQVTRKLQGTKLLYETTTEVTHYHPAN